MKLKKIKIIGFKSFADSTELEFTPGITCIVGPNGCGKSNIADAFRWVLGEQSAKTMRGGKMQDVIFAGATTRKPLNMSEVVLTFTGIEGELPIGYHEVAVGRRLHRSGESDYLINRNPVRLRDIQSLFMDSGLGKEAYSIFEQGKIDQVIQYSPLERRYLFEEAAGILRFLQRKQEALRKLEQSDQNIHRIQDIHREVEKQITVLEQQADKARLYKAHRHNLEELEKRALIVRWESQNQKKEAADEKKVGSSARLLTIEQEIETLVQSLHMARLELEKTETALQLSREEVFRAKGHKEIKGQERQAFQERMKEISAKEKKWQHELEGSIAKRKERQVEFNATLKRQKEILVELEGQEADCKQQRDKVQVLETTVSILRETLQKGQQELLGLLKTESQIESELKQNALRLENSQERLAQIHDRKKKIAALIEQLTQQVAERNEQVQSLSKESGGLKGEQAKIEKALQEVIETAKKLQEEINRLQTEWTEGSARQKALRRLRDDCEGFSKGAKRLLQEASQPKSPLYKKVLGLYEYIQPAQGSEMPVAAAMRRYSQTLVVETPQDRELIVDFAKNQKLTDFSLICLEDIVESSSRDRLGKVNLKSLLDQVEPHRLAGHLLKRIWIADSVDDAIKGAGEDKEIWVDGGPYIDSNCVFFYAVGEDNTVFLREAELKKLDASLEKAEKNLNQKKESLEALNKTRTQLFRDKEEVEKSLRRNEMKFVEVNFGLQRCQSDLDKAQSEAQQISVETLSLNEVIDKLKSIQGELAARHQEASTQASKGRESSLSLNADLEKQVSTLKAEQRLLQDRESKLHKLSDENRKLLHALNVLEVKDLESRQLEERLQAEIIESRQSVADIQQRDVEFAQILQSAEKKWGEAVSHSQVLEKEVGQQKQSIAKVEEQLTSKRGLSKQIEGEVHQLALGIAQIESTQQNLEAEMAERYQLTIAEMRNLASTGKASPEEVEKQVRALRHQLEQIGDVNMTALEECDKHKERYSFLGNQLDDLQQSKQELVRIITQLDTESRQLFQETFAKVSANFKKNFQILFNGGEADLQFTESDDVLEAGIEIIAKPPGKQMRSINLLSGGEKCLTAMALLFALFEVKPAPFCILDEIDAPLDDANVERFVNLVKEFADRCQFIIITHNKKTMAIGDVLFGVSMEEKGVSKIISMAFKDEKAPQPVLV